MENVGKYIIHGSNMGIDRCVCYVFLSELTSFIHIPSSIKKQKTSPRCSMYGFLTYMKGATWPHEQVEEVAVGKFSRHMQRIWEMKP